MEVLDASQSPAGVCVFVIVAPSTIGDISPLVGRAGATHGTHNGNGGTAVCGWIKPRLADERLIHSFVRYLSAPGTVFGSVVRLPG